MKDQIYIGTAYYPEHWDEADWGRDLRLMREAGLNFVRLAEFAWSKMEPVEGKYDFGWLDRAIDLCVENELDVILCTPTAAPPPWMLRKHPDICPVDVEGCRLSGTSTRHCYCVNSPAYRDYSRVIASVMAERYNSRNEVFAWQIDNEFASSVRLANTCYCSNCVCGFQDWVKSRYGTLDALNEAWGTIFSSNTYSSWEEVLPPDRIAMSYPDPAHALDYRRFISDSHVSFQKIQVDAIREQGSKKIITHNLAGDHINYYDLFDELDVASWDNYPSFRTPAEPHIASANHDSCRGYKGKNFWILEQQTKGQMHFLDPGYIRLYTYQGIGRGADLVAYYRWRLCRFGREQFRSGIVDWHGGVNRRYDEVKTTAQEIREISPELTGSECRSEVAILTSFDIRWAFAIQQEHRYLGTPVEYPKLLADLFYRPLFDRNISVDVPGLHSNALHSYKLIIAPYLYLLDQKHIKSLKEYAAQGGFLMTTVLSGYKDLNNNIIRLALPGEMKELIGATIQETNSFYHVPTLNRVKLSLPGAKDFESAATVWGELLKPTTADVIGRYSANFFEGTPAVTLNRYGKGAVLHIGTVLDAQAQDRIIQWAIKQCNLRMTPSPDKVEISFRYKGETSYAFVLNHCREEKIVDFDWPYVVLPHGKKTDKPLHVEGLGVRVIRIDN